MKKQFLFFISIVEPACIAPFINSNLFELFDKNFDVIYFLRYISFCNKALYSAPYISDRKNFIDFIFYICFVKLLKLQKLHQ